VRAPIWHELLVGIEFVSLRISPVYSGHGVPHGDGSKSFEFQNLLLSPITLCLSAPLPSYQVSTLSGLTVACTFRPAGIGVEQKFVLCR
jgi:hypothetical protein